MLRSEDKFLELCKGLKLPLNGEVCSSTDILVKHIYDKYFENRISEPDQPAWLDPIDNLCKSINISSNQTRFIKPCEDDVWIFGYGSLIWKPDFPFIDRKRGFIRGYRRLFYQNSIDHRGTKSRPGRVVTLLPTVSLESRVYGVAYRISSEHRDEVLAHLDYREKNGYDRCEVKFYEYPEQPDNHFSITMYIATPDNESYAGNVWQLSDIAQQIFTAAGPSGPNREYLFNLASAVRELFPGEEDRHLYDLEAEVKQLITDYESKLLEKVLKKEITEIVETGNADGDVRETIRDVEHLYKACSHRGWREELLTKELESLQELLHALQSKCSNDSQIESVSSNNH
ncbi:putative glutathione-specific gamma-glutamylcyclotransferase 2 [Anastrepha obliqua]|uniref:putative glutathione-specific gamma-glutamylcyclotransferase 2 n=1 Tax=Anastrepha obliqua TaxID=95512 RepID=UPI00240A3A2B|nr:putative glutathione-specific gamma-glutamylcyclotransferase 2 [Anastrepha obliqua]XP_054725680.1 putative glutathione-specific gamma-glutamylcyclotransferase 2 [Anastrepha obliqua]